MKRTCKKGLSLLLSLMIACSAIAVGTGIQTYAATFDDLNQSEVFIKQSVSGPCVLDSCVMMIRRTLIGTGNSNWASVTESSLKGTACVSGSWNVYYSFSYMGVSVKHASFNQSSSTLQSLLAAHPEGIVLYSTNVGHAVLVTDYTNGKFYAADPSTAASSGRIQFSNVSKVTLSNATEYWYVSSPKVTLTDPSYTLTVNYYSNYADKSFANPLNAVGANKNVLVRTTEFVYAESYQWGLNDYSIPESGTYLGRGGYHATCYWNTMPDGSGLRVHELTSFASGQEVAQALGKDISTGNATVNVYAEWEQNKLVAKYYSNYADKSFAEPLNAVGADRNVLVKTSDFLYAESYNWGLNDFSLASSGTYLGRTGYTTTCCWNTEPDGSGLSVHQLTGFTSGQEVAQLFGKDLTDGNAEISLYPEWKTTVDAPKTYINKTRAAVGETITFTWDAVSNTNNVSNYWLVCQKLPEGRKMIEEINNSRTKQFAFSEPGNYSITALTLTPDEIRSGPNDWKLFTVYTTYELTFDANGGACSVSSKTVDSDLTYGTLPVPTRNGYLFDGWYTSAFDGTQIEETDPVTITANTTLYAHWTAVGYTVTLDPDGGTCGIPAMTAYCNEPYGVLPVSERDGFVFDGWFLGETLVTESTVCTTADDHTLTAHWTAVEMPVTVVPKEDSTAVIDDTRGFIYGLDFGLTADDVTNDFLGVTGNGRLEYDTVSVGTGTVVSVIDNDTGETIATYVVVIFGDLDGDGMIGSSDFTQMRAVSAQMVELPAGSAKALAADINHDGLVNATDYTDIRSAAAQMLTISQSI